MAQLSSDVWPLMNLREAAEGTGRRELTVISSETVQMKTLTAAQILIRTQTGHFGWYCRIKLFAGENIYAFFFTTMCLPFDNPILFGRSTGYFTDNLQWKGIA